MRIKHILVNWALDDEELLEPYEWEEDDDLELLEQALLVHVHREVMNDLFYGLIYFENLDEGDYLVSDGQWSLAIRVDDHQHLLYRSVLPFEYRKSVSEMARMLPKKILNYDLSCRAEPKKYGLTRLEREKKQWLMEHIEMLGEKELQRLCFLISPLNEKIGKEQICERLEHGYTALHAYLYECFVTQKRHL